MRALSLAEASEVYRRAEAATLTRHPIHCSELLEFWRAVRRLEATLGGSLSDRYWRRVRGRLWRYWLSVCATPLSFDDPLLCSDELRDMLSDRLLRCGCSYPNAEPAAASLHAAFERLRQRSENPVRAEVLYECGLDDAPAALVVRESRLVPAVQSEFIGTHVNVQAVSAAELSSGKCYERLIVVGPARWFPESLFMAPRAAEAHILVPDFIRDTWQARPSFRGALGKGSSEGGIEIREIARPHVVSHTSPRQDDFIDAERMLPTINWDEVLAREGGPPNDQYEDMAQARALVLEGDRAVLLDSADNAKSLVLDLRDYRPGDAAEDVVRRIRNVDIGHGMFLLLRTEGGGDVIPEVADKMVLGPDQAPSVRGTQKEWKSQLQLTAWKHGLTETAIELLDLGAKLANESNLRNWMSERNIRPQHREDFYAIMSLLGLDARAEEFLRNALTIDRAHRRAGFIIRERLIEQIPKADLRQLERLGIMDFEFGDLGGGKLTAIRVVDRLDEKREVSASRLGRPFDLGDEPWRE